MDALERLFRLEIEYNRILRCDAPGTPEIAAPRTSYAIQNGYEALLRGLGPTTKTDVDATMNRLLLAGDPRDVTSARDSLNGLLGL
jgi:hypothetical protein